MPVDVKSLTTKMDGAGIEFVRIIRKSPILSLLFYDPQVLYAGNGKDTDLKPKTLERTRWTPEDGRTYKWRDIDLRPGYVTLTSAATSGATSFPLSSVEDIIPGDQIYIPSIGETVTATGVSSLTVTFSPAIGANVASGAEVRNVSYGVGIGGDGKGLMISAGDEQTNYLQDLSIKLQFTQDDLNKLYLVYSSQGFNDEQIVMRMVQEQIGNARSKIFQGIARAFYAGKKASVTVGGKSIKYAGGFREFYTTNTDCTGATAEAAFEKILDTIRPVQEIDTQDGSSGETILVCSPAAATKLSALARKLDLLRDKQETNFLGTVITELRTVMGTIRILTDTTIQDLEGPNVNVAYAFKPGMVRLVSSTRQMRVTDVNTKEAKVGMYDGITLMLKPQNLPNSAELEVFTNFSFIFGGNDVGAGVRLYNVGEIS